MGGSGNANDKKLTITKCTVDASGTITPTDTEWSAMINPAGYAHGLAINYNKEKTVGTTGPEVKFDSINPETLSFETVIDGTGVIPDHDPVKDQLKTLMDTVYKYDGDEHETTPVRILWSNLIFYGRLTSISLDHSMFTLDGEPLRTKVKLAFESYISNEEETKKADRSSPDLTHVIEVKAGDTLPLLCHRVYKDSSYYLEIARYNDITNFRQIRPGTRLAFPPLK